MRCFKYLFLLFTVLVASCSTTLLSKRHPDYVGVDPKAKSANDEFLWLSTQKHIVFKNKVTIGFKNIGHPPIIGLCNYGIWFREIDLDIQFWEKATNTTRMALVFHELSHCYCDRDHDHDNHIKYEINQLMSLFNRWRKNKPLSGYWSDGCPTSLMSPVITDDACILSHYREYIDEMFYDCKPW